jgi:PKD-like domain
MRRAGWLLLAGALMSPAQGSFGSRALAQKPDSQCPSVKITCPSLTFDSPVIITAEVSGADSKMALSYNWSISAGKIIRGQGTRSITIDTSRLQGQSVTATLDVGGIANCPITVSCSLPINDLPPVDPPVFDQYSELTFQAEKQRLDNLADQLRVWRDMKAYIVFYAGRRAPAGEVRKRVERARRYLIAEQGIAAERIVFADGGERERLTFQLYLMPDGFTPALYPTIAPDKEPAVKTKTRDKRRRQP